MYKLDLEKAEESEIIANIRSNIEKATEFQKKNIYFCLFDDAKAFDCNDHNKQWKILREMGIPDHLTCLLRNLYTSQEATVSYLKMEQWTGSMERSMLRLHIVTLLI